MMSRESVKRLRGVVRYIARGTDIAAIEGVCITLAREGDSCNCEIEHYGGSWTTNGVRKRKRERERKIGEQEHGD